MISLKVGLKILRRKWRVLVNPEEWQMRLLGLKASEDPPARRGLVLIQIDGLSYPDLERAMGRKHLPFLRRMMRREHYQLSPLFSGIPSNTPAFQGEFFFGKTQCVPAFQYRDHISSEIFTMYDKTSAAEMEKRLSRQGEGLMAGGSAYCDIFSGGAAESHICASTADLGSVLKAWNPYSLLVTFLVNPYALLRGIVLCLAESALALADVFRGVMKGHDVRQELLFIFTRVFSSILVREIAATHAQMDIYRGLPVIHVNYFGYDEQAHRRGPSTRFAYWSLSGIDNAARKIWRAAIRAKRRHYEVWIYSDHGQEKVIPFLKIAGKPLPQAVQEIYNETREGLCPGPECPSSSRGEWDYMAFGKQRPAGEKKGEDKTQPVVTTLGPIAQIYFPSPWTDDEKRTFAKHLREKYPCIPLIAVPLAEGEVEYQMKEGNFWLPEDAKKILGADHPYLEPAAKDLECLLKHESRGDLVLFGWAHGAEAISFSNECGAHAGLGFRETQAFALLPADAPLEKTPEDCLRARDLRQAALRVLGKIKAKRKSRPLSLEKGPAELRVMSYNVHSCTGRDGLVDVERIARIIAKSDPDVVALQELDMGRRIKGGDQAAAIARELEMHFHFHPVCGAELQCFGNAILSRYPMRVVRAEHLPGLGKSALFEPRGVLWVEIDFQGQRIHLLNTHLSLWGPELKLQIRKLLGPDMLGSPALGENAILCGDFNMTPGSPFHRMITKHFKEPHFDKSGKISRNTWTSQWPVRRLDHIFMRGRLEAQAVVLPRTRLECSASDHLPIAADFKLHPAPLCEEASVLSRKG